MLPALLVAGLAAEAAPPASAQVTTPREGLEFYDTGPLRICEQFLLGMGFHSLEPSSADVLAAQESPEPGAAEPGEEEPVRFFPPRSLYPSSLADFHDAGFAVLVLHVDEVGVAEAGESRFYLKLGGRFPLLRINPRGRLPWQIELVAGFQGQFDIENQQDNLGWDGIYGLLATARSGPWAFKGGLMHTSSHVGDEYAERTGRRRIGYTREELMVGVSRRLGRRFRTYGELAWGHDIREESGQEPGRAEVGLEYLAPGVLRGGRWGWYWAVDLSSVEERDWQVDPATQVGLAIPSGDRRWRIGVGAYDGRMPIGELYQDDERYLFGGLWLDLP